MDYYTSNKIFSRMITPKKKRVVVTLSEETKETLRLWELDCLKEEDALVKLQRMLHTAPSDQKDKIRKAISELRKKEIGERKELVRYLGKSIYLNWGEDTFGGYITPDTWYRDGDATTFFYFVEDKTLEYDSGRESHYNMLSDNDLWDKIVSIVGEFEYEDFVKVIYDADGVISGRCGDWESEEDEEEGFAISIWTQMVDKDVLVDMMDVLDKELGREHEILFVPDKKMR